MKLNKKQKIAIRFGIVTIMLIVVIVMVGLGYRASKNKQETTDIPLEQVVDENGEVKNHLDIDLSHKKSLGGKAIIGMITIEKIGIHYPILQESNEENLKLSICRFFGSNINGVGNVSFSGHHNVRKTMFSRLEELVVGDTIVIEDSTKQTVSYRVEQVFKTDKDNTDVLKSTQDGRQEITLITCSEPSPEAQNRVIVKAVAI